MSDAIPVIIFLLVIVLPFLIPIIALLVGLIVGTRNERLHLEDLDRRESETADIFVSNLKSYPGMIPGEGDPTLVLGEVSIASDRMKNWLAGWRHFFGGEMSSYESLQRRARREARLRVVEQAREAGYNAICNLRLDSADIAGAGHTSQKSGGKRRAAMVSVIASGTAYHLTYDE